MSATPALYAVMERESVAAAGQENDGNDDDPEAVVVVKQIAKTVVHNDFSLKE